MPTPKTAELDDRGLVTVTGPDAAKLLQGLITNDLGALEPGHALFAGLLAPQGKILFDFFIVATDDGFLIELAKGHVADFIKRLTLYRLRAEVTIEDSSDRYRVLAIWGPDTEAVKDNTSLTYQDPRHADLGQRRFVARSETVETTADAAHYHCHRIALGVPEGGKDYAFSDAYPHEALFDQLAGVSFTKGCFIGQEVVSRMEHRNATKNAL